MKFSIAKVTVEVIADGEPRTLEIDPKAFHEFAPQGTLGKPIPIEDVVGERLLLDEEREEINLLRHGIVPKTLD